MSEELIAVSDKELVVKRRKNIIIRNRTNKFDKDGEKTK
jgi:hypothetical protein